MTTPHTQEINECSHQNVAANERLQPISTTDETKKAPKTKKYKAVTTAQSNAVLSKHAYVVKESNDIICMRLDALGGTGRAYPFASIPIWNSDTGETHPAIWYQSSDEDELCTKVEFPELVGWEVFALVGGETCEIVLTKGGVV